MLAARASFLARVPGLSARFGANGARLSCGSASLSSSPAFARSLEAKLPMNAVARRGHRAMSTASPQPPAVVHRTWSSILLDSRFATVRGVDISLRRILWTSAGLVVVYTIYEGFSWLTRTYLSLTIFDTGEVGFFLGGIACSLVFAGGYVLVKRYATVTPEVGASHVMRLLRNERTLRDKFGAPLKQGEFRAYAYKGGFQNFYYTPRRLQMIMHVSGPKDSGTLSFDIARRWNGGLNFRSLAIDVNSSGERLIYEGRPEDVIYNGVVRLQ